MSLKLALVAVMAAGKTSISELVASMNQNVLLVPEPVEKWRQSGILEKFYNDKKKYALEMQWNVVKTRHDDIQEVLSKSESLDNKVVLLDGHVQTDRHGFVQTLYEGGNMTKRDKAKYEHKFDELMPNGIEENEFFVYLRCEPEVCLERASIRARSEETGIALSYLKHLHKNFEIFSKREELKGRIITLDVSKKTLQETAIILNSIINNLAKHRNLDFELQAVCAGCARRGRGDCPHMLSQP
jgi:deoxyadenosine/deoxycytidine kinase